MDKVKAARSLTWLFTDNYPEAYTTGPETLYLDDYPEPIASKIGELKTAFRELQIKILEGQPNNVK